MFKFVVVLCSLIVAASAVSSFGRHGGHHNSATSDDAHAEVTHYVSDVRPDGFDYTFDTTNAIHASASGDEHGDIKGDFSWISPEGEHVAVQYVADENGYQPSSDVLPTPHPIPKAILRAIEYIRTHPPKEESSHGFGRRF
ncbi:larval cuticle protein 4-like [Haematobia irritans]|uniref:larval cuticle protein 4-like n=1 Tax=Haematobia irritans TaxID=7368 RepID=UPI003F4F8C39